MIGTYRSSFGKVARGTLSGNLEHEDSGNGEAPDGLLGGTYEDINRKTRVITYCLQDERHT